MRLEASSNGCAVIISNRGGLPETITNGIILKKLMNRSYSRKLNFLLKIILLEKNIKKVTIKTGSRKVPIALCGSDSQKIDWADSP